MKPVINKWLNPFVYIDSAKALVIGLVTMSVASILSLLIGFRFDGLIDYHYYDDYALYKMADIFIGWLVISLFTMVIAMLLKKSFRAIDVLGMYALAFAPLILYPIFSWVFNMAEISEHLSGDINIMELANELQPYIVQLLAYSLFQIAVLVLFIYYLYQAYKVNLNVTGSKGVVTFVVLIVLAEIFTVLITRFY